MHDSDNYEVITLVNYFLCHTSRDIWCYCSFYTENEITCAAFTCMCADLLTLQVTTLKSKDFNKIDKIQFPIMKIMILL